MNKWILAGMAALLCVAGYAQESSKEKSDGPSPGQKAIERVLQQRFNCLANHSRIIIEEGVVTMMRPNYGPYHLALKKIEVEACPKKFRLAWFDYLSEMEKLTEHPLNVVAGDVIRSHPKDPVTIGTVAIIGLFAENAQIEDRWTAVKRAALESGVEVEKIRF